MIKRAIRDKNYPRDVLKRRYKITHLDLRDARRTLREAKAAAAVAEIKARAA